MKVLLFLVFFVSCCESNALKTEQTNNSKFNISLLFEHDGCKVYRFIDDRDSRYFVKCSDGSAGTTTRHQSGKTSLPDDIQTVK